jgi:flagellar basal body-associated protein FliL
MIKTKIKMESKANKNSYILPISLAVIGLAAAVGLTILLLRRQQEEDEQEQDVENYDMKNAPLI